MGGGDIWGGDVGHGEQARPARAAYIGHACRACSKPPTNKATDGQAPQEYERDFRSECSWGLLGYILARGIDVWRRGASIHDCGNGNVELPQRATSSLTFASHARFPKKYLQANNYLQTGKKLPACNFFNMQVKKITFM